MNRIVLAAGILLATASVTAAPGPKPASTAMNLHLSGSAPHFTRTPLAEALQRIGAAVQGGYVLFGLEIRTKAGEGPTVTASLPPGITLKDALTQVLSGTGYDFRPVSSRMVEVFPRGADTDPHDAMNLRVDHFDAVGVQAGSILSRPQDFIPALRARLMSRPRGGTLGSIMTDVGPPPITLHLRDVTVREILNAVSEATEGRPPSWMPLSWVYTHDTARGLPSTAAHVWRPIFTVPKDWRPTDG